MNSSPTAAPRFERSFALVIGINAYSQGIPALHNAVHDATALAETLEGQGFEVVRLLDAEASLSTLSHLLSHQLPSLHPPPDRLLIYFAGHGLAHVDAQHNLTGYLLPCDASRDSPSSYLRMDFLRQSLRQLSCKHLLLILDCCFAGAFPHTSSRDIRAPFQPEPLFIERFRHFSSHRSFQILVSTAHDELASDRLLSKPAQETLGGGQHSPFALALLEALQPASPADFNKDGLLTTSELYTYLRDKLLSFLPAHSQQTPSLWPLDGHDGGEFLFLLSRSFPALPSAAPLSKETNPYLGLRPFSSRHRHLFFGRERIVDSLLERLRTNPFLVLCAPSGSGKSSLVHAGLLPRLAEETSWRIPPSVRSSSQPLVALASWLAFFSLHAPSQEELASQPDSAARFIEELMAQDPQLEPLLVVDPLEELVTVCFDESIRLAFLRALAGLLHIQSPRLRIVLLVRSDFEPHFLSLLARASFPSELWHDSRFNLRPMNRDELRRCIEKPAEASVLFFAPNLVECLLDDIEQMPGALPLLSVALSELFEAYLDSGRDDRTLSFAAYQRMGGGIAGALQRRAELVFSGIPPLTEEQSPLTPVSQEELPRYQSTLRNVLLRMVSPEGGELARRRVPRAELEYSDPLENTRVQRALSTLEAYRLVVASDDSGPAIEPAHDALLVAWPRLHDWARHTQRELLLLRRVSQASAEWHRHNKAVSYLWADARLDQLGLSSSLLRRRNSAPAVLLSPSASQPTDPLTLNAAESEFLRASHARQRQVRTRRNTFLCSIAATLVILTVAAFSQASRASTNAREAQRQQELAEARAHEARLQEEKAEKNAQRAKQQEEAARASEKEARRQKGIADVNATLAQHQKQAAEASAMLFQQQKEAAEQSAREAQQQKDRARQGIRLRSAEKLVGRDPTKAALVLLEGSSNWLELGDTTWLQIALDTTSQAISRAIFPGDGSRLTQVLFSPDGAYILTTSAKGTVTLWRADGQGRPTHLPGHKAEIKIAFFSPDSAQLVTISVDGVARLWPMNDQGKPRVLAEEGEKVDSAIFSPDGIHILTTSSNSNPRLWRRDGTGAPIVIKRHGRGARSATFSSDGSQVLVVADDGSVHLWQMDGSSRVVLGGNVSVRSASFTPDGFEILLKYSDDSYQLWRADGLGVPYTMGRAKSVEFSADGFQILEYSGEGSAYVWATGSLHLPSEGNPSVSHIWGPFDRYVTKAVTVSDQEGSGTHTEYHEVAITFPVVLARFSPSGSHIVAAYANGQVDLWPANGQRKPTLLVKHSSRVRDIIFRAGGSQILTIFEDGFIHRMKVGDTPRYEEFAEKDGDIIRSAPGISDGVHVPMLYDNGASLLWRLGPTTDSRSRGGHTAKVLSAAFSPDGSQVLTASADGTARLWSTDDKSWPIAHTTLGPKWRTVVHSPEGSRLLILYKDKTSPYLWRWDGKGPSFSLKLEEAVSSATFSPDGGQLLTGSVDGTVRLWRMDGKSSPLLFHGHTAEILSASFNYNGSQFLTTSADGSTRVWHTTGRGDPVILRGGSSMIMSAAFSADGLQVLTASADGTARIWSVNGNGGPVVLPHMPWVRSAAFAANDSRVLTTSSDGTARIWQTDGLTVPVPLATGQERVTSAIFSPTGRQALTLSTDNGARLWPMDGQGGPVVLPHTSRVLSATFSPDGAQLLTICADGTAYLWAADGTRLRDLPIGLGERVKSARFRRDGSQILTLSESGAVSLWRVDSEIPFVTLRQSHFTSAFFLPDGAHLATVDDAGVLRVWPVAPTLLYRYLLNATTACLSMDERVRYLYESADEARKGFARCELSHDR